MTDALSIYRDDGPLVDVVSAVLPRLPLPSMGLVVLGVLSLLLGLAVDGGESGLATLLGVAAFVLLGLASERATPHERIQWLVPPLLRGAEYGLVIMLAWRADPQTLPVAYGLLAALAFHHYDIVYRLRHQRVPPPDWIRWGGGGWEGRVIVLSAAALTGFSLPAMLTLAGWCAVLFASESMVSWIGVARDERRTVVVGIEEPEEEGVD